MHAVVIATVPLACAVGLRLVGAPYTTTDALCPTNQVNANNSITASLHCSTATSFMVVVTSSNVRLNLLFFCLAALLLF